MSYKNLLIIDDEHILRQVISKVLELEGYVVWQASDIRHGLKVLEKEDIAVVISDVKLPDGNGLDLLKKVKEKYPLIEVVVITAYGTISDGVKAIKEGAFDYITKGDNDEQIIPIISRAMDKVNLQRRIMELESKLSAKYGFENIVGSAPLLKRAIELAQKVAPTDATVLLLGETGTGKEVFAQAIHQASKRSAKPFVAVNCSAIAKDLLESEMFGYKAGAFTGAMKDKKGLVEEAHKGTLFLDEIGELNLELQAKLLRFLETGTYYKAGDSRPFEVDVRIIAATNRDLPKEIEKEHFREDLYYRLSGFSISLPALRERKEDIPKLATWFLEIYSAKVNKKVTTIDPDFLQGLQRLEFKGNTRELKNIIERAVILTNGQSLTPDLLPAVPATSIAGSASFDLATADKTHILKVLEISGHNKTKAAELLDIGLTTLYRKLHEYGIE
jgi:two-component system, NtrC family, response regulator